jgi:hypothetical protein
MSLEGRIAIDVNFTDTSTAGGASSVKKISLVDTQAYSSGKVAVVTGTVGTATQSISLSSYLDASGSAVSITSVSRIAFKCSGNTAGAVVNFQVAPLPLYGPISKGETATGNPPDGFTTPGGYSVRSFNGTVAYTAVFYGT